MKRIVAALAIIFGVFTMASAQQEPTVPTPARPVPALPGMAPAQGVPSMHPVPAGQHPPGVPVPRMADPFHDVMFPPGMILDHARQLNLTDDQKAFIRAEIQKTTTSFHELQWNLQDQMELLHGMMKAPAVSEEQALGQLNRVLDIEREIKRLHFGMALRLKNKLTPDQQEQLHKMRTGQHMRMPPPPQPAIPRNPENPIQ